MDSRPSESVVRDARLHRLVSWLLIWCQALAVALVVAGWLVAGATGQLLLAGGVLALVGAPFLALARIGVFAGRRGSALVGYAVGALAIALLGAWLAR